MVSVLLNFTVLHSVGQYIGYKQTRGLNNTKFVLIFPSGGDDCRLRRPIPEGLHFGSAQNFMWCGQPRQNLVLRARSMNLSIQNEA